MATSIITFVRRKHNKDFFYKEKSETTTTKKSIGEMASPMKVLPVKTDNLRLRGRGRIP